MSCSSSSNVMISTSWLDVRYISGELISSEFAAPL
ncbi:hypothetical protein J2S46_000459 [Kitasatospora herbaricolor]|nr:hypothetical protein [Kitasatospora herbaricolor]